MDTFAKLPASEREVYCNEAAAQMGLSPHVIEKDFWVCWTLKRLFSLQSVEGNLLFKGGTTLSKVYGLIRRFSEDIDLSIHRTSLGFTGERDPAHHGLSNKRRKKLIEKLGEAAREKIAAEIQPELLQAISDQIGPTDREEWSLGPDPSDGDNQSLAFQYPSTSITQDALSYLKPAVKIEFGARADHWPAREETVRPYIEDAISGSMGAPEVRVKVMSSVRTFWEKATILHQMAHLGEKTFLPRHSRHYYDLAMMIEAGVGEEAVNEVALLTDVAEHKRTFFRSSWASYETAVRGTLRLLPAEAHMPDLAADLASMRDMFFDEPPALEDLADTLRRWEQQFNAPA